MIMSGFKRAGMPVRQFSRLADSEVVALAIRNETEAAQTYRRFADVLSTEFPASAKLFTELAEEEAEHGERLTTLFRTMFGEAIPAIETAQVRGIAQEHSVSASMPGGPEAMRRRARQMEDDAVRFYHQAAGQVTDPRIRRVFAELATAEAAHGPTAEELDPEAPPTAARVEEIETEKKNFVLRVIQPGLVGPVTS